MKYTCLLPLLALVLLLPHPTRLCAQNAETDWVNAFSATRINNLPRRFTLDDIRAKRAEVWQAWQAARPGVNPFEAMCPLDSGRAEALSLPDTLEPRAVMPYYIGTKGERPVTGYPLFIYLHGSGPKAQEWATGLILAKRFEDAPSAYLVPQIPNEGAWYRWYQRSKQWAIEKALRFALSSNHIDASRLYLFGISEGGYGSQRLASFYADYLAAAGPMAGGEPLVNAPTENLRHVAFSFLTGAVDNGFYRNQLTRTTARALDSLERLFPGDYRHRIRLIPERGHSIDYSPTTPWMAQYVRRACPAAYTWEDYEMDGRHRSGFYNLKIVKRPAGDTLRTRYDVSIADNRVDIRVSDVHYTTTESDPRWGIPLRSAKHYTAATGGHLRLFLNEEQVDFRRRVEVYVNGRRVFRGRLAPSTDAMRESVTTYFDPARVFPARVDIAY